MSYEYGRTDGKGRSSILFNAARAFHFVALSWYLYVFIWHWTPAARVLPGATGFGWFFRYLTFYSYTLQLLQLLASFCSYLPKELGLASTARLADDLACATFGLANVVTSMFYLIDAATNDVVEGGKVDHQRPPWLGMSVHLLNSVVAWVDILLSHPRSFSRRSQALSVGLIVFYLLWIQLCSFMNSQYPYPFLNKLPQPQGFLMVSTVGILVFIAMFRTGKWMMAPLQGWKAKNA